MARTVLMVDTSKWQASDQRYPPVLPMDWRAAAARGVLGAYIKATEALSVDPEVSRNNELAGAQGIKRGPYHFFRSWYGGVGQAQFHLETIAPYSWEMPPALDVEVECYAKELWRFIEYTFNAIRQWCVLYTSPYAWSKVKDEFSIAHMKSYKRLIAEHCALWQAQYPNAEFDDGVRVVGPDPIKPWSDLGKDADIHQYSARNKLGAAYGSVGSVSIDLDLAKPSWFDLWPWPPAEPQEQESEEMHTRFVGLVNGQNVRSEPSTRSGNRSVIGLVNAGQILFPVREMAIVGPGEVWLRFDPGWVAAVHGGKQYLKAVS